MANMNYCRFQNTWSDLKDCVDALWEGEELDSEEAKYAHRIAKLCQKYLDAYGEDGEGVIEEDDTDTD